MSYGHNTCQTAANVNRVWGEGSTYDKIEWCWFLKYCRGGTSLEEQTSREHSSRIKKQHLKALFEQKPHQSV